MDSPVHFADGAALAYGADGEDDGPITDVLSEPDAVRTFLYTRFELATVCSHPSCNWSSLLADLLGSRVRRPLDGGGTTDLGVLRGTARFHADGPFFHRLAGGRHSLSLGRTLRWCGAAGLLHPPAVSP